LSELLIQNTSKKRVIIHVQYGLSNRLRALASAWWIAQRTGRELLVIWEPDVHCDCTFDDLFINHGLNVFDANTLNLENSDIYDYMNAPLRRANQLRINHETGKDLFIKSAYNLDYNFIDQKSENEFLRKLRPVHEAVEVINRYDISDMIGLHIRMGAGANYDKDRWDSDEFLDATAKELMHYWRSKSHYNNFIPLVEQILSENPAQKFFLAADMQLIYDVFKQRFGESVVYHPRNIYDRSKQQQITALIDMYSLSRTKLIYGSTWSAFTELAARLGGKPVKLSGRDFGDTSTKTT
jgi:hypothetical protein